MMIQSPYFYQYTDAFERSQDNRDLWKVSVWECIAVTVLMPNWRGICVLLFLRTCGTSEGQGEKLGNRDLQLTF